MALAVLVGLGVAAISWKPIFGDLDDFLTCVKFWLMPDIISILRGEYFQDVFASMKLLLWLGLSFLAGFTVL